MILDEIHAEWAKDSIIDSIILDDESLNIAKLHSKYLKILSDEKMVLAKFKSEFARLKYEKYIFYIDGQTQETKEKGWIYAAKGKILKNEVDKYLDGDTDLIKLTQTIAYQQEKTDILKSILESLDKRSFNIGNALKFKLWEQGA
jgi:hypothetical protein